MNSNYTFDVVVIGGGPHGITYANWIKQWRPETSIVVIEKQKSPGYKIGESTLSTATRSFIAQGLSLPVLRRLFGNKNGIRFWWTDEHTDHLRRHVDVVDIEETFQVERRVLETALHQAATRRNITLMTGTRVLMRQSDIDSETKTITCEGPDGPFTISCKMVCDASGPASLIARNKKLYRKAPERNQTFTTHAYYAYFKQKKDVPVPHWQEPATRHICFPGGWMWFVNMTSWEQTPNANLQNMIQYLLDHEEGPDESYPSRQALCEQFGCTTEETVSIGFVIRADQDDTKGMSPAERFRHYVEKHPAISWVMDHYELIDQPYGKKTAHQSFHNLVHDSEQMAGDGWCLVGDAAAFVNPIFSPGLNLGSGSCYMAARATVNGLNANQVDRSSFGNYEHYMRSVYNALLNETDMYYRSFNHVDSYEWTLLLKIFYGAADIIVRDTTYTATDPYVHDLLNPAFIEHVDHARQLLRHGEEQQVPPLEVAMQVRDIVQPFVQEVLSRPHVQELNLGTVLNQYTSMGERVSQKERVNPQFGVVCCDHCTSFMDNSLGTCPVCGTPRTPAVTQRLAA